MQYSSFTGGNKREKEMDVKRMDGYQSADGDLTPSEKGISFHGICE